MGAVDWSGAPHSLKLVLAVKSAGTSMCRCIFCVGLTSSISFHFASVSQPQALIGFGFFEDDASGSIGPVYRPSDEASFCVAI